MLKFRSTPFIIHMEIQISSQKVTEYFFNNKLIIYLKNVITSLTLIEIYTKDE